MRTHRHRIVLVGAGRIGRIHAANAAASPRIELAGVVDPVASAAAALAEEHATSVTPFAQALDDPGIAGVVIASSTDPHLESSCRAAAAGNAIFCENPGDPYPALAPAAPSPTPS